MDATARKLLPWIAALPSLLCAAIVCVIVLVEHGVIQVSLDIDPPPPTASKIPLYPGSQRVSTQDTGDTKTLTFQTTDSFEQVLSYYSRILKSDRWVNPLICKKLGEDCDYLPYIFEWRQGDWNGPTDLGYRLMIEAVKDAQPGTISVTLVKFNPLEDKPPFERKVAAP